MDHASIKTTEQYLDAEEELTDFNQANLLYMSKGGQDKPLAQAFLFTFLRYVCSKKR